MRMLALAVAVLLSSCATSGQSPYPPAVRITFEVNSWGYVQERWSIGAAGDATLDRPPAGSQLGTAAESQTFSLTGADFERINSTLAANERFIAGGIECRNRITDAPYGKLVWRRADGAEQQITFDTGCERSPEWSAFFERVTAADGIFHQLTGTPAD
jgi:hypothetical protein